MVDVTDYIYNDDLSNPELIGVDRLNDKAIFILNSHYNYSNRTDFIVLSLSHDNVITRNFTEMVKLSLLSSCFSYDRNCAYFIAEDFENEGIFPLLDYNCTSDELTLILNCSFNIPLTSSYIFRAGRLLNDQISNVIYFVCPIGVFENCEFALFKLNTTNSTFNLLGTTSDTHSYLYQGVRNPLFDSKYEYFDVFIIDDEIQLLSRASIPHTDQKKLIISKFLLSSGLTWTYIGLELDNTLYPFYSGFIFDSSSKQYLNSYIICYTCENSIYHSTRPKRVISALSIYGNLFDVTFKPFLIHVMKSSYFWLAIFGPTGFLLLSSGVLFYFIKKNRKKKKLVGN